LFTFRDWINRYGEWRDYVFQLLSQRLATVMAIVDEIAFRRVDVRLAEFLLQHAAGEPPVLYATHQHIAAELGTSREVVSRILAVLRRHYTLPPIPQTLVNVDDRLSIYFARREVLVDGKRVNLRPTEYRLLYHLVQNAGYVLTHEMLLSKVWGPEYRDESHYLRLYITYLRQKIEEDPSNPRYILTERGVGYRFVDFPGARRINTGDVPV